MDCGCDSRQQVMSQGDWKMDAAAIAAGVVTVTILHGGAMSNQTRKMLAIALTGAVVALLVDGYLKPKMLP